MNMKPYQISVDWLAISAMTTTEFHSEAEETASYKLTNPGYGAKFWKQLRGVNRKVDNRKIGTLCWQPTTTGVNPFLAIFKVDNELLYDEDCYTVICHCLLELGLQYHGISRIDLACDFNSFKQNLHPMTLMEGYFANKYLKGGSNKYMLIGHHDYFAYSDNSRKAAEEQSAIIMSERPILDKDEREREENRINEANKELLEHGLPPMKLRRPRRLAAMDIKPHVKESLTWGNRSSGVQVQLYNKTREMQEVAPKWYIVKTWANAGLDTSKDVWRLEIRINNRGKELVNTMNGKTFNLHLIDILVQKQVEDLFFAYVEKYFKWYRNDGHEKLQNCKRLILFDYDPTPIVKPKQYTREAKGFTRTVKTIARDLEKHRIENEVYGNEKIAELLEKVRQYYIQSYKLGRWYEEEDTRIKMETGEIKSLVASYEPLDERYYSTDGLRAMTVAHAELMEKTLQERAAMVPPPTDETHYAVDWDKMSQGEKNIYALFYPIT